MERSPELPVRIYILLVVCVLVFLFVLTLSISFKALNGQALWFPYSLRAWSLSSSGSGLSQHFQKSQFITETEVVTVETTQL